jgi:Rrf2 family protein
VIPSKSLRYAVRLLTALPTAGANPRPGSALWQQLLIPPEFGRKVLSAMVKSGLVHTSQGPKGGFWLARPLDRISLLEVIESVDGQFNADPVSFSSQHANCELDWYLDEILSRITDAEREFLGRVHMADLSISPAGSP